MDAASCRHCVRRRAQQTRRHRLRLRNVDLFEWACRRGNLSQGDVIEEAGISAQVNGLKPTMV